VKRRSKVLEGEGGGLCVVLSLGARAYPDILAAAAAQKGKKEEEGREWLADNLQANCEPHRGRIQPSTIASEWCTGVGPRDDSTRPRLFT
jgi:hypothetical protein